MAVKSAMPAWRAKARVFADDRVEDRLVVADQVHLVDGENDIPNAEQVDEEAVPPGLGQHALSRIDQDHRQVRGRSAGDHVAGILFVAGRVGDDELALLGREEAVGDVDGDALLALGGKAVDQQREVQRLALRPRFLLSVASAESWSSNRSLESYSSRPISVDLPSSTLPQVMKRSSDLLLVSTSIQRSSCSDAASAASDESQLASAIRNSPPASSSPCSPRRRPCRSPAPRARRWWRRAFPG